MTPKERVHALELAEDLLTDIELDRLPVDKQVLKASRLARLVGDDHASEWLQYERMGYASDGPQRNEWRIAGRGREVGDYVYPSVAVLQNYVDARSAQLSQLRIPDVSGDWANAVVVQTTNQIATVTAERLKYDRILVAVSAMLHDFATKWFYALRFSERQGEMFDQAQSAIHALLSDLPGEQLRKIDAAYDNISAGDTESIASAMNSIRRLIDAIADELFPATDETRQDGQGNQIKLGVQQRLNRLKAYVDDYADSKSRADRLKRAVSDVYGRVSTGVHNDVAASEAEYLFLSTYVLVGEIVGLSQGGAEQ